MRLFGAALCCASSVGNCRSPATDNSQHKLFIASFMAVVAGGGMLRIVLHLICDYN